MARSARFAFGITMASDATTSDLVDATLGGAVRMRYDNGGRITAATTLGEHFHQHLTHIIDIVAAASEGHRQRQHRISGRLGVREITASETESLDIERL